MPKHKKTREQKMKADERKLALTSTSSPTMPTYVFSSSTNTQQHRAEVTLHTDQLVRQDLLKTAIISFIILFLQILLFTLLKNHVLAFSFVRY